ncbi:MAG: hypothetical protein EBQ96_05015 [Proteobacteria bacterium]|nr:hypothetical protein [Pseudomonadota bacterium]
MPDAETPVVWIMDLSDAATAVIRIEADRQGLSVLKKYGGKGAAETVAVYRDRKKAERALIKASHALEKARDSRMHVGPNAQPVIIKPASKIGRLFTFFLYVWFALYLGMAMYGYLGMFLGVQSVDTAPQQAGAQQKQAPTSAPSAPAASIDGVPMSADDFLKQQSQKLILP